MPNDTPAPDAPAPDAPAPDAPKPDAPAPDAPAPDAPKPDAPASDKDKPADKSADDKGTTSGADLLSDDGVSTDAKATYEYKLPEGVESLDEADSQRIDELKAKAAEMGLSQEQFQATADLGSQMIERTQQEARDHFATRIDEWREACRKDGELGGNEERLKENIKFASLAIEKFGGGDDLKALLASPSDENPNGLGLGNHPEVLRVLSRAGRLLSPDGISFANGTAAGETLTQSQLEESMLKGMYPNSYKEKDAEVSG